MAFSGYSLPIQADIAAVDMMKSEQELFPARRAMLMDLLQVRSLCTPVTPRRCTHKHAHKDTACACLDCIVHAVCSQLMWYCRPIPARLPDRALVAHASDQ